MRVKVDPGEQPLCAHLPTIPFIPTCFCITIDTAEEKQGLQAF